MNAGEADSRHDRVLATLKQLLPAAMHDRVLLVGGTVRDLLLGQAGRDLDLIAACSHEELLAAGFRLIEPASSTAIYFRHQPVSGTLELTRITSLDELGAELLRRDFRCNAIAMTLQGGVVDPLDGSADVRERRLRPCTDRTFAADPLRIFRAFRFEAAGWRMTPEADALIRVQDWAEALHALPVERFSAEMLRALSEEQAERFFGLMISYAVGKELLPELFRMPAVPAGPPAHHPEGDLLSHSLEVLQRTALMTTNPVARFCALFHDIGKLATDPSHYPRHHGHEQAGFPMAMDFCNRLRLPAAYRAALAWVSRLHGTVNRWPELRDTTRLKVACQAIRAGIHEVLPLVAMADKAGGRCPEGWEQVLGVAGMSAAELGIGQERLEAVPVTRRSAVIQHRRLQVLRAQHED